MNLRNVFEIETITKVSNMNCPTFNPKATNAHIEAKMLTHVQVHIRQPPKGFSQNLPLTKLPHHSNIMPSPKQSSNQLANDAQEKDMNNINSMLLIVCSG